MTRARRLVLLLAIVLVGAAPQVDHVGRVRMAIVLPDGAPPIASVLLIPGGDGRLKLDAAGVTASSNFVVRTRDVLVRAGFAIAYLEDLSDVRAAIARLRRVARPVFLLSTSVGTIVALRSAATFGDAGPDGIILTSIISRGSNMQPATTGDIDVRRLTVPALLIANQGDTCPYSSPAGATALAARFPAGADVTIFSVESHQIIGADPCGAAAPHGYLGVENEVTERIVAWMRSHIPNAASPPAS